MTIGYSNQSPQEGSASYLAQDPLSIIQLIHLQSLDVPLAALLWILMDHRASVIVAATPRLVGKTTTLVALLDLTPRATRFIALSSQQETFAFRSTATPETDYLIPHELSDHTPQYIWGDEVRFLFEIIRDEGYAFGTTMHASNPTDVLNQLSLPPITTPIKNLLATDLILMLKEEPLELGLHEVTLVRSNANQWDLISLATWNYETRRFQFAPNDVLLPAIATKIGQPPGYVAEDWSQRATFLDQLVNRGVYDPYRVRQAILTYEPQ